jgi:hypothetical protein
MTRARIYGGLMDSNLSPEMRLAQLDERIAFAARGLADWQKEMVTAKRLAIELGSGEERIRLIEKQAKDLSAKLYRWRQSADKLRAALKKERAA